MLLSKSKKDKLIYKFLKESVAQLDDVELIVDIINSILNNKDWYTNNETSFDYSGNKTNVQSFVVNQLKPYTWDEEKKQELVSLIIKIFNSIDNKQDVLKKFLSVVKNNKQDVTNYYDIRQLNNMKQMIEKEVKRILFGISSIPNTMKELNNNWKINSNVLIKNA